MTDLFFRHQTRCHSSICEDVRIADVGEILEKALEEKRQQCLLLRLSAYFPCLEHEAVRERRLGDNAVQIFAKRQQRSDVSARIPRNGGPRTSKW